MCVGRGDLEAVPPIRHYRAEERNSYIPIKELLYLYIYDSQHTWLAKHLTRWNFIPILIVR